MDKAKDLLRVYRAGGQDAVDPEFAGALQELARNPALAEWFEEQQQFDSSLSRCLKDAPVPASLRASILAAGKPITPHPWWSRRPSLALAAALLGLLTVVGLLATQKPTQFTQLRQTIIEQSWSGDQHLDLRSSDLAQIRQWLADREGTSRFELPQALKHMPIVGCKILQCEGRNVTALCLRHGVRHTHFFVMDGTDLPGRPGEKSPDFEQCQGWSTASWSHGDYSYMISGMKPWAFLKIFRKAGQWGWTG